jgi:hypothetical protein
LTVGVFAVPVSRSAKRRCDGWYGKLLDALGSAEGFLEDLKPTFLDKLAQRYDPAEAFEE